MRAVLDSNVFVSALISPAGPSAEIVLAWVDQRFELIVSPALIAELDDVLARPRFRRWISESDCAEFITGLADAALVIDDPLVPAAVSPDPDDDYLLCLGQAAGADYLVSGDRHLTGLVDPAPPVLTPRAFLQRLSDAARG